MSGIVYVDGLYRIRSGIFGLPKRWALSMGLSPLCALAVLSLRASAINPFVVRTRGNSLLALHAKIRQSNTEMAQSDQCERGERRTQDKPEVAGAA